MAGMDTVLVTGSGGLIGWGMANLLWGHGRRVVGYDLAPPREGTPDWPMVTGDVRDAERLSWAVSEHEVLRVVHCGGISGPMVLPDDPAEVFEINVGGTVNVFEAARRFGLERVVFMSSNVAYGDVAPGVIDESTELRATEAYGASKVACEAVMRSYRADWGVDAVALRVGAVYGPRRTTFSQIREFLADALAGRPTVYAHGIGHCRPWLYVDDAVAAVVAALDAPAGAIRQPNAAYNIAGDEWLPLDAVAEVVRKLLPAADIRLGEGVDPADQTRGPLDISAAERDLGWRPEVSLHDGVARYLDWMRAEGKT